MSNSAGGLERAPSTSAAVLHRLRRPPVNDRPLQDASESGAPRPKTSTGVQHQASVLIVALVVALASAAHAQEASDQVLSTIASPEGWEETPELASSLPKQLTRAVDLGGMEVGGGATAYVKRGTGILYLTWLRTKTATEKPEAVIRSALDSLREAPGAIGPIEELEYSEKQEGNAIDSRYAWQDVNNETITRTRLLVWRGEDSRLRFLRAECLYSTGIDDDALARLCDGALETLEADEIGSGKAASLGSIAAPAGQAEPDAGAAATGDSESSPSMRAVDPNKPLYQADPKDSSKSAIRENLWLFVVGGVLILFAFWAATRGRQERDDSDEDEEGEGEGEGAPTAAKEEEE